MSIRIERQGSVTTVIIDRPQARNAIDRANRFVADGTARQAADALAGAAQFKEGKGRHGAF